MKILTSILTLAMLSLTVLAADGPIRHVVHFNFKVDADKALVAKVVTEFAALKGKISAVEALEYGTNVSPEKHDKGFTHCWIATFKNAAARDAYLVDSAHQKAGGRLVAALEGGVNGLIVVDLAL